MCRKLQIIGFSQRPRGIWWNGPELLQIYLVQRRDSAENLSLCKKRQQGKIQYNEDNTNHEKDAGKRFFNYFAWWGFCWFCLSEATDSAGSKFEALTPLCLFPSLCLESIRSLCACILHCSCILQCASILLCSGILRCACMVLALIVCLVANILHQSTAAFSDCFFDANMTLFLCMIKVWVHR